MASGQASAGLRRHLDAIATATNRGRLPALRWLVRTYISTPQEKHEACEYVGTVSCNRKARRWLGERLGKHCMPADDRPLSEHTDGQLELAKWHVDHYGLHWGIDYEIPWGHPETAKWMVEQFGAPPGNPLEVAMVERKPFCYAENLQVMAEAYSQTDVAPIAWLATITYTWSEIEPYRWLERRYGPPTSEIRIAGRNKMHQTARWLAEKGGAPGPMAQREQTRRYQADAYGLHFDA